MTQWEQLRTVTLTFLSEATTGGTDVGFEVATGVGCVQE